jgi:hypothetical protein
MAGVVSGFLRGAEIAEKKLAIEYLVFSSICLLL